LTTHRRRIPLIYVKTERDLRCSGSGDRSSSTSGTRRVTLATNPDCDYDKWKLSVVIVA